MPQVQQSQAPKAVTVRESKAFRDRLRDRYAPSDYVRVINIDDEPYQWQYFPSTGEDTYFTDNGNVRVVEGRRAFTKSYEKAIPGKEQLWEMAAGESEVILGENADLFIEGLYKRMVAKGAAKKFLGNNYDPKKRRNYTEKPEVNFNWNDGAMQEQMIDQIFLGVERPNFENFTTSATTEKK